MEPIDALLCSQEPGHWTLSIPYPHVSTAMCIDSTEKVSCVCVSMESSGMASSVLPDHYNLMNIKEIFY
jgi:hypothetical protein